ncbi:MAG: radical SAM protein [Bacteroidota bacterium]
MKTSKFNTTLPYGDNVLLYNSFSDHFILVNPLLKELLEAAEGENDINGLVNYHPGFYKELLDHGFILNNQVDEIEELKKLSLEVDSNASTYLLTINPTMGCNFKCWYCYETHIAGSKMEEPIIEKILRFLENQKNDNPQLKHFSMAFFGGEPLIYYRQAVVPLLKGAKKIFQDSDVQFRSSFTTNGYLLDQEKIDFLKDHHVGGMQITLDGNKEFHNKVRYVNTEKGSYEKIISNIKLLVRNGLGVTMRINYTNDNFFSCMEIADDFADLEVEFKKKILVDFHQVWQDEGHENVSTRPGVEKFSAAGFSVRSKATNLNNVRDSCYADKRNSATFNYNGEVFKCTARDFTTENSLGILTNDGYIQWKEEYERRQTAKFHNAPCFECKLMPICNGGCSQHAYEHLDKKEDYCVFGFNEHKKDELILERFRMRAEN